MRSLNEPRPSAASSPTWTVTARFDTLGSRHLDGWCSDSYAPNSAALSSVRSISMNKLWLLVALALALGLGLATPAATQTYGPELQGFDTPSSSTSSAFCGSNRP